MPPHVVVGVDGSPASAGAAAAGARLALAGGGRCHLVHATVDPRLGLGLAGTVVPPEALQEAFTARIARDLAAGLRDHVPASALERLVILPGRPGPVLAEAVRSVNAGLLVLGGKHRSMLDRWFVGSTVRHAVRRLTVPLLVTAGELPERPRVLVALDLSSAAEPTARAASAFANLAGGGSLRALHVLEPMPANSEAGLFVDETLYKAAVRRRIERELWPLLAVPRHDKVERDGLAAEAISEEAAEWRADVIVVGSHGKGWVDRMLIGSVTEQLLNRLPAGVLVVPVPAPVGRGGRAPAPLDRAERIAKAGIGG